MMICCLLHITFRVTHWLISVFIAAISVLLSSFEYFLTVLFDLASDFYGTPPRASFPTENCAILILGAHEGALNYTRVNHRRLHPGAGKIAALSFSELGHTVPPLFYVSIQERSGPPLTSDRSRDAASVRSMLPQFHLFWAVIYDLDPNERQYTGRSARAVMRTTWISSALVSFPSSKG